MTLKDVARKAGVSTSTVSHVVNQTRFVEAETAARVQKAIEELGYCPNRVARGLRTGQTRTIGVLGLSALDQLFAGVVRGIEERCWERGYEVFLGFVEYPKKTFPLSYHELNEREARFIEAVLAGDYRHPDNLESYKANHSTKETEIITKFLSREVDGLILNPGQPDSLLEKGLSQVQRPLLFYQRTIRGLPQADSCVSDDYSGIRSVLEHLIGQGHRRIAMLYGFSWESHAARERFRAWVDVHREHGLLTDPALLRQGLYDIEITRAAATDLLQSPDAPSAIVCWSDAMALSVMDAARSLGLRVPEDVSVTGYDDLEYAALSNPRLSSVHQPRLSTGHAIADRILDRIEGLVPPEAVHLVVPTEFQQRESSGPRRTSPD